MREVIQVTWADTWSDGGHMPLAAARERKPYRNNSIGYLIEEDQEKITLAFEFCEMEGDADATLVRGLEVIPKNSVIEVRQFIPLE